MIKIRCVFTLLELLVVVSIMMILMSILMPSLQNAKNSSRTLVCTNNLKNMGVAFQNYLMDNDDYTTSHYLSGAGTWVTRILIPEYFGRLEYVPGYSGLPANSTIALCPLNPTKYYLTNSRGLLNYLYNESLGCGTSNKFSRLDTAPSKKILFTDGYQSTYIYAICQGSIMHPVTFYAAYALHRKHINIVWGDGHVEPKTTMEVESNQNIFYKCTW